MDSKNLHLTLFKQVVHFIFLTFLVSACGSGSGGGNPQATYSWTWEKGSNTVNSASVYGSIGVSSTTNTPGARRGSSTWVDSQNNLWLFGGSGYDSVGMLSGSYNDLWKFDGSNWTWVSGSQTAYQQGTFGTKGVAAVTNQPAARWSAMSWTDTSNNLWLYGGEGYDINSTYGHFNDLWKFDGTNWIWISGDQLASQPGVYGTKGIADSANVPGARYLGITWIDSSNTLWLFGGHGYDSIAGIGRLNDLWKFDGTNWIWVSGANTHSQSGVYGVKNIAAISNMPGARYTSISWKDKSGNLWLFGGNGHDINGFMSGLNDLWKFDGTYWTWVSGSDTFGQQGDYGTKGTAANTNIPGSRNQSVAWTDSKGVFWLFGGYGEDASGTNGRLNDLWKYDGTHWTWVSGTNSVDQAGNYGSQGFTTTSTLPGSRRAASAWADSKDTFWLFGGVGYDNNGTRDLLNDLWSYRLNYAVGN